MRGYIKLAYCGLLFFVFACGGKKNNEPVPGTATGSAAPSGITDSAGVNDSMALALSKVILTVIKHKDFQNFALFIDTVQGIRFSPYGYIDTINDKKFSATDFLFYINNKKNIKLNWGTYDGNDKEIVLTLGEYFEKFVYDVDFLNADSISLNKTLSNGNSLNNIDAVYKNCTYVEYYFPGFEKKYEGMDWRSLKLVFKKDIDKLYLIAVIHDEWTI